MKNNNLFNGKDLKSFRSFLRNKATLAEAALWDILKSKILTSDQPINHPGPDKSGPPLLQKEGKVI
jgi:hypothetical protein